VGLGQARGDRLLDRKALRWNRQDTALSEASYAALGSRMPVAASARGSFGAGRASDGTGTPSPFAEETAPRAVCRTAAKALSSSSITGTIHTLSMHTHECRWGGSS